MAVASPTMVEIVFEDQPEDSPKLFVRAEDLFVCSGTYSNAASDTVGCIPEVVVPNEFVAKFLADFLSFFGPLGKEEFKKVAETEEKAIEDELKLTGKIAEFMAGQNLEMQPGFGMLMSGIAMTAVHLEIPLLMMAVVHRMTSEMVKHEPTEWEEVFGVTEILENATLPGTETKIYVNGSYTDEAIEYARTKMDWIREKKIPTQ